MNVDTLTRNTRRSARRLSKRGEHMWGEMSKAGARFAGDAAERSEQAFRSATKSAERALADLAEAASDLYDDRKDDAEDLIRDARKSAAKSFGSAISPLMAKLPSERRRRRRRAGLVSVAAVIAMVVGYRYWVARKQKSEASADTDGSLDESREHSETSNGRVSEISPTTVS